MPSASQPVGTQLSVADVEEDLSEDKRVLIRHALGEAGHADERVAVEQGSVALTYGELRAAVRDRMGQRCGDMTRGELVAIDSPRSIGFVVDLLAVFALGGIPVPLDPGLPRQRRQKLFEQLPPPSLPLSGMDAEDGGYVFFTSGSTGLPKPVLGSAAGLRAFVFWQRDEFGVCAGDRVPFLTALGFDVSLRDVFLPLCAGATLVIPDDGEARSPESTVEWLASRSISRVHVVPSVARAWLRYGRATCDTLRTVFFAGEPLTTDLLRAWPRLFPNTRELVNLYGPTETTLAKFSLTIHSGSNEQDPVPVGAPLPGTRYCLLGKDDRFDEATVRRHLAEQPHADGEIVIVTPHASRGYLEAPDATRERFVDLGKGRSAYRTGDLGRRRGDGRLVVVGRTDDEVKLGGVRVHPSEVTVALRTAKDVEDAFVLAVPGRGEGYQLVAFVAGTATAADLREHLAARLPRAMLPARFVTVGTLPITPNGKVDRAALLTLASTTDRDPNEHETDDEVGRWLRREMEELLDLTPGAGTGDFFALGGTSIVAMQLASRIRQRFHVDIPVSVIFREPTAGGIARQIAQRRPVGAAEPVVIDRANGRLPMSFAQRRIYFLHVLDVTSTAYHIAEAIRLRGRLDVERLQHALRATVSRNEVLRTVCVHDGDEPELRLADEPTILRDTAITRLDADTFDDAHRLLVLHTERPFDLDAGLPIRATLVRLSGEDHLLLVVTHHIATDERSTSLLLRQLLADYAAATRTTDAAAVATASMSELQYADYAAWQREQLTEEVLAEQLGYWRERLAGMPPKLELPADAPAAGARSEHAIELGFTLDTVLRDKVFAAARDAGVTPFVVLLTAFGHVLHRHCATGDVAVATPASGRAHPALDDMLGCFINTLVLRLDLTRPGSRRELLRRAGDTVLGAVSHQDLPYDRLVAELRPNRDSAAGQHLAAMFNHHDVLSLDVEVPGLALERIPMERTGAQFDLACTVVDHGEEMIATFTAAADRLSPAVTARLGEHFLETLAELLADLDGPADTLPPAPRRDRAAIPTPAPPDPHSLPLAVHQFEAHAAADPERVALRCLDDVATYGEVNRRANQLARYLLKCGLSTGDVVALHLDRSVALVVAMLAVQKAGGVYVPLDPVFPANHVATIIDTANARLLVTHDQVESVSPDAISLDQNAAAIDRQAPDNPGLPLDPAAAMYILFTSGSSGRPKGVVVEHRHLACFVHAMRGRMALPEHLSFATVTTFAADLGMTNIYGSLTSGGTLHVVPYALATDPEGLAEYFGRHRIDFMKTVPSHLAALNEAGVLRDVMPWRYLVLAGEAFHWDLADDARAARPGCEIWNHYGPTETTVDVLGYRVQDERIGATVPIGSAFDRVQAHILDRRLQPVPLGTPGELVIGGASVARGYLTDAGPAAFVELGGGRAYRTGDRVRRLPGGEVEFLGRIDRQVKIRGYRVEPSHVEATLHRHPTVADAAVLARADKLVAYVVPGRDEELDIGVLREHALVNLPRYMVPSAFVPIDRLPVTPNGKLDARALPEPDAGTEAGREVTAPRNARDARMVDVWRAALGVANVGIDDDFFALGGDSITAMRVVREIGAGLRVISLFQHPTIRRLADSVADSVTGAALRDQLLYRMSASARVTPTATIVAVPFGGGSAAAYHDLARALPDDFPLYAVELPAHDFGRPEQELEPFDTIVARVVEQVRASIDGPIVVYGHCVGAAMAFAIAQELDLHGTDVVGAVFGGAYPSPQLPGRLYQLWYRLFPSDRWRSDRLYQEMLRAIGGVTDAVDPDEQAFIVRALRNDSRGADAYYGRACHDPAHERRLRALCVVGERDRLTEFSSERHHEWDMLCASTDLAVIPQAGHYFVKHQAGELADIISGWGTEERPQVPPPVAPGSSAADGRRTSPSLWSYLWVTLGELLAMTGTRLSSFGLGVWVFLDTGSATLFSVILVCAVLPGLLVMPFAGAAVDRWDRRLVLIAGNLIGATGPALCLLMYTGGALQLWHIYLAAGIGSVANAFQQSAYIAATTQLVPKQYLPRVSGVTWALVAMSQTVGPLIGAALVLAIGVGGVLILDLVALGLGVVILLAIRFPNTLFRKREESVWSEVAGGFTYIARRPGFVAMNGYFLVYNLLLGAVLALAAPIVLSFASAGALGLTVTMQGVGGVAGGLVMALWGGFARRATGMIGFCILTGAGMIAVGMHPSPLFPIVGMAMVGASIALLNGHWQTLIQNKVGMELQGRMITTNRMVANLTEPLGYFCAGWLADQLFEPAMREGRWLGDTVGGIIGTGPGRGMGLLLVVLGVAQVCVALIGLRWRTLHHMEDVLPDAIPGAIVTWDRNKLQEEADRQLPAESNRCPISRGKAQ